MNFVICSILSLVNKKKTTKKKTGNDEELTIAVQKYPAIFDKSNKNFRHKDVKINAWEAVADEYLLCMTTVKGEWSPRPKKEGVQLSTLIVQL